MRKVLILTSYASPYKVEFFDELGKYTKLTVLFSEKKEEQSHRDGDWFVQEKGNYQTVQLEKALLKLKNQKFCTDVFPWLKKDFDDIIIAGYSSPTAAAAILYLKLHRIPFYMEVDGGLIREDSPLQYRLKKFLVSAASQWISSGSFSTQYLTHYGAEAEKTHNYPFTSLWEKDIRREIPTGEEKEKLRQKLSLPEKKIILFVGRFTEEKGMDVLLHAAPRLDEDTGIGFVGVEPTEAHLEFCRKHHLDRLHFTGFHKKQELAEYYQAADLLVLPTKSDVWGLVINEAMAMGLPVITTDRCGAGLELVRDGVNGYLVPVGDGAALEQRILETLRGDYEAMGRNALETIRPYTIENMTKVHVDILEGRDGV